MLKAFRQIALMGIISRLLGMARDMAFAYIWGRSGLADLWVVAFMVPNLATRVLGEGGLGSSAIPTYMAELQTDRHSAARFAGALACFVSAALGLVAISIMTGLWLWLMIWPTGPQQRLLFLLMALMLPYMVMAGLSIALGALLNAHQHFLVPASSPVVLNVAILAGLMLAYTLARVQASAQVMIVSSAVVCAGLVQLAMHVGMLRRSGVWVIPSWDLGQPRFRQFLRLVLPTVIGLTATQTNVLLNNLLAYIATQPTSYLHRWAVIGHGLGNPLGPGAVSGLYYAQRLYQFPVGVLGIALATAIFPTITKDYCTRGIEATRASLTSGIKTAVFVAAPASALLVTCSRLVVAAVFQHGNFNPTDTAEVSSTLACYALGLIAYFLQQVLTRAFYSMASSEGVTIPLYSGLVAILANILGSILLIRPLGAAGLALSTALAAWLQVSILAVGLGRMLSKGLWPDIGPAVTRILLATAAMTITLVFLVRLGGYLPDRRIIEVLWLAVTSAASGLVYLSTAWILGLDQVRILLSRQRT